MNARLESSQIELFPTDAAAELAYAKTCPGGMELSPEAQALYEKEGAERFREFHGRRLIEVTKEQKESIDSEARKRIDQLMHDWRRAVAANDQSWMADCFVRIFSIIDAHTAAAVAKARLEGMQEAQGALSANDDFYNRWIDEQKRAERAEAALAQPVDLSKLTRYGFDGTLGGDFGKNNLGPYVKLSDVEQLISSLREGK